jgi:hypothetical protein
MQGHVRTDQRLQDRHQPRMRYRPREARVVVLQVVVRLERHLAEFACVHEVAMPGVILVRRIAGDDVGDRLPHPVDLLGGEDAGDEQISVVAILLDVDLVDCRCRHISHRGALSVSTDVIPRVTPISALHEGGARRVWS